MRYNIEDIEDQLIATLQADAALYPSCQVKTHAGDVNAQLFMNPALMEGFITQLPFVFIQYQGKELAGKDAQAMLNIHTLRFRLYIGAQSLRAKQESQRSAYSMLRLVYDDLHGKWPKGTYDGSTLHTLLEGTSIATTGFTPQGPVMEAGGRDEMLIVNLPQIVVYQTDYTIKLLA